MRRVWNQADGAVELDSHALALERDEQVPRTRFGGRAGDEVAAAIRRYRQVRLSWQRVRQNWAVDADVPDARALRASHGLVVALSKLLRRARLEPDAATRGERHPVGQNHADVLELRLPDRIVLVVRVSDRHFG